MEERIRELCWTCFWPKKLCWCSKIQPMALDTKVVLLMHPKEFKQEKAGTGRLTHLCIQDSEILVGVEFDQHPRVRELLADPSYAPFLLYPGPQAKNVSQGDLQNFDHQGRRLLVFLLDATWSCAKKMLRVSPGLQTLPQLMFTPQSPSRFVIKQQPHAWCLSTLEATHELLLALHAAGKEHYTDQTQLLRLFMDMQQIQLDCAADPNRPGYRRRPYKKPEERVPNQDPNRRNLFLNLGIKGQRT